MYCNISFTMKTSSNGNIFRVTGHLCEEFTGYRLPQRPVTWSFEVFFDLRRNERLSKQSFGWWFETPLRPLWRHRNAHDKNLTCTIIWKVCTEHCNDISLPFEDFQNDFATEDYIMGRMIALDIWVQMIFFETALPRSGVNSVCVAVLMTEPKWKKVLNPMPTNGPFVHHSV